MNENELASVIREEWHTAEMIDGDGIYTKKKYREIQQICFYIRPIREWWYPCPECQKRLAETLRDASWILGNKDYEPMLELNMTKDELDEDSWVTLETHKATSEELKRIRLEGYEELD